MKIKNFILLLTLAGSAMFITSCGGDDDVDCDNAANWAVEVLPQATAYLNAFTAFSMDPSTENCNAYINALQDYIDAVEPWGQCLEGVEQDEWQTDFDAAQASLDGLSC